MIDIVIENHFQYKVLVNVMLNRVSRREASRWLPARPVILSCWAQRNISMLV